MKKQLLLLFAVALCACHQKNASSTANASTPTPPVADNIKSIIIDATFDVASKTIPTVNVDSMKINGDVLSLFVNYGGGCKEHTFDLYTNGNYAKSLPPQVTVFVKHENNGDACRKLVMRELKFNIAKLKYGNNKTIAVKLGDKQVRYTIN